MRSQHELLNEYVNILLNTNQNLLVVKGTHGIGKTYLVSQALNKFNFENGVNYQYVSGFTTPLSLFNTLSSCKVMESPKLFWFDDIEGIINNRVSVSLLKSALWERNGKKIVSYQSSTSELKGEKSIEFDGKVILILNTTKEENLFGKSLLDRGIFYEMKLSPAELTSYIENILPLVGEGLEEEIKREVWNRVKRFANNDNFSLRSLSRAFEFYKYNDEKWWTLFLNTLNLTEEQRIFYLIKEENLPSIKAQAEKFSVLTGKSTKTFQRLQKKL